VRCVLDQAKGQFANNDKIKPKRLIIIHGSVFDNENKSREINIRIIGAFGIYALYLKT